MKKGHRALRRRALLPPDQDVVRGPLRTAQLRRERDEDGTSALFRKVKDEPSRIGSFVRVRTTRAVDADGAARSDRLRQDPTVLGPRVECRESTFRDGRDEGVAVVGDSALVPFRVLLFEIPQPFAVELAWVARPAFSESPFERFVCPAGEVVGHVVRVAPRCRGVNDEGRRVSRHVMQG